MVPALEQAVFSLNKGDLSQPIKTQDGYHIIQVTEITPQKQLSYDEAKESVKAGLLSQMQAQAWASWLSKAESELGVSYRAGLQPAATTTTTSMGLSTGTSAPATATTVPGDSSSTDSGSQSTSSSEGSSGSQTTSGT